MLVPFVLPCPCTNLPNSLHIDDFKMVLVVGFVVKWGIGAEDGTVDMCFDSEKICCGGSDHAFIFQPVAAYTQSDSVTFGIKEMLHVVGLNIGGGCVDLVEPCILLHRCC